MSEPASGPDGRVFAYEPTAFAYGKLLANIALNPALAPRIVPVQAMLIGEPGARAAPAIHSSWPLATADDLHPEHRGRAMTTDGARAVTLDEHLRGLAVPQVALLKIDVDGFECTVLRGAEGILRACRPLIVMEWAPYLHEAAGHRLEACLSVVRRRTHGQGHIHQRRRPRVNDQAGPPSLRRALAISAPVAMTAAPDTASPQGTDVGR